MQDEGKSRQEAGEEGLATRLLGRLGETLPGLGALLDMAKRSATVRERLEDVDREIARRVQGDAERGEPE